MIVILVSNTYFLEDSAEPQVPPVHSATCTHVFLPSLLSVSLEAIWSCNLCKNSGLLRRLQTGL